MTFETPRASMPANTSLVELEADERYARERLRMSAAGRRPSPCRAGYSGDPGPLVLVADDDDDIRSLICIQLARAGYDTIAARDGAQALRLAHDRRPELCIFDLVMPKLDGLEATRALRKSTTLAGVPVIMLTAAAQTADRTRCLEAGADEYMSMPFHAAELETRVKTLLSMCRPRADAFMSIHR